MAENARSAGMAEHSQTTLWCVLPSLPMFLLISAAWRVGATFSLALSAGVALTILLYLVTTAGFGRGTPW